MPVISRSKVACLSGAEKMVHDIRSCVDEHWMDWDFAMLKIDLHKAFNLMSRQAILDECAIHFPELLPWTAWCYGQHPMAILWSINGMYQFRDCSTTGIPGPRFGYPCKFVKM